MARHAPLGVVSINTTLYSIFLGIMPCVRRMWSDYELSALEHAVFDVGNYPKDISFRLHQMGVSRTPHQISRRLRSWQIRNPRSYLSALNNSKVFCRMPRAYNIDLSCSDESVVDGVRFSDLILPPGDNWEYPLESIDANFAVKSLSL